MKLLCNCEKEHEQKFVCDYCLMRAEWEMEINNLFNDEFDGSDSHSEKQFIIATRLIIFLYEKAKKDFENGHIDQTVLTKISSSLEELRSITFLSKIYQSQEER